MSVREGRFCDFKIPLSAGEEPSDLCGNAAVGTCPLCGVDYCSAHSVSDNALSISVGISKRTPGSAVDHTEKVIEMRGPMCIGCSDAFAKSVETQRTVAAAARDAAVKTLAAMQVAEALATDPPRTP